MKIEGLRNILMKKAHNDSMRSFLYHMADTHLVRYVNESLEKMAKGKGVKSANPLLEGFGRTLADSDKLPQMIYDHLSHHATRYKAALKNNNQSLANKHVARFLKALHLIDKLTNDGTQNHTRSDPSLPPALLDFKEEENGKKVGTNWVDPKPWERHAFLNKQEPGAPKYHPSPYMQGHYRTATKGIARDAKDYSYLQKAPHHSYHDDKEIAAGKHTKAWPIELTMVNGRYVHIDDDHKSDGNYEPHPLDEHPIMDPSLMKALSGKPYHMFERPSDSLTTDDHAKYDQRALDWGEKYLANRNSYTNLIRKNPDIGLQPSLPAHADVEPLDLEHHAKIKSLGIAPQSASQQAGKSSVSAEIERIKQMYGGAQQATPVATPATAPAATPATNKKLSMSDVQAEIARIKQLKG